MNTNEGKTKLYEKFEFKGTAAKRNNVLQFQ